MRSLYGMVFKIGNLPVLLSHKLDILKRFLLNRRQSSGGKQVQNNRQRRKIARNDQSRNKHFKQHKGVGPVGYKRVKGLI